MGKLFKRYLGESHKKAGGKVRAYIAEGQDDRFCIAITAGTEADYILRLSEPEVRKLTEAMQRYLAGATTLKK